MDIIVVVLRFAFSLLFTVLYSWVTMLIPFRGFREVDEDVGCD